MKAREQAVVPPLTSKTRKGVPYTRHADVTDAIALALALPKEQWEEWATRSVPTRLPSEALVFLVKAIAATDKNLFAKLVWELHRRIQHAAKRWARGFDRSTTEELIETVQRKAVGIVLATPSSRQSEFLEVAFNRAVKLHTLNAVEKRRYYPLPMSAQQRAALERDEEDSESVTERVIDDSPQVEELVSMLQDKSLRTELLRRAKDAVKDRRHYEALLLRYGFDWPITTPDSSRQSLRDLFGVSERQINNWLRDGMTAIRKSLENTHDAQSTDPR